MPDAFSIYDEEPDDGAGADSNVPKSIDPEQERTKEEWARERRKRADLYMFGLPPFQTPSYAELRKLYRVYRHDPEVRRLILEIQCGRYALSELAALAGECFWDVSKEHASLEDAHKTFARLRSRLRKEIERVGQIYARKG